MQIRATDTHYCNRVAKRLRLSCFVSGILFLATVSSGESAPRTPVAIKGSSAAAPKSEPAQFVPFVPASGEFSILMPGRVMTRSIAAANNQVPTYSARSGITNYVITGVNLGDESNGFDQYLNGFVESMKKRGSMSSVVSDASGQGWTGKLCNFTRNGNERVSAIVAKTTGSNVIYSAMIDVPASSEQSKEFLGSLIVYPEKAIAAHQNDSSAKKASVEMGRTIGTVVGALFGLGLAIFLVKRFPPPKKKSE